MLDEIYVENISNDDPEAIEKLNARITYLQNKVIVIKSDPNYTAKDIKNVKCNISRLKKRIEKINFIDSIKLEDLKFDEGYITVNESINRIQIFFNPNVGKDIIDLIIYKFRYDFTRDCWEKMAGRNGILATYNFIKDLEKYKNTSFYKFLYKS